MTCHALSESRAPDIFFGVLANDLRFIVFMTAIAGIRCIGLHMAGRARDFALIAVHQREGVLRQTRGRPSGRGVARRALRTE